MAWKPASPYRRLAVALLMIVGLFVVGIFVFPDALPIFPAIAVPIWLALFPPNRQYDARTRRMLRYVTIAGVITFAAGIVAFILVS